MILAPTPKLSGQIMQIDGGLAGVRQTLATMRQLVKQSRVDPAIRQAATQAAFLMPEKDELSEVDAIFSLVRDGSGTSRTFTTLKHYQHQLKH